MTDHSVENLWTIKVVLRGFELTYGLGVKYHKSSLIGVNIDPSLLELVEDFLHCKIKFLLFHYSGLLVGANPRLEYTWKSLINLIHKRLNSWSHRYVHLEEEWFFLIKSSMIFMFSVYLSLRCL